MPHLVACSVFFILGLLGPSLGNPVEPPFPPDTLQEINRLSNLPSLVSAETLLQAIDPASIEAYAISNPNTNNSQSNPIAKTFPNDATGTLNGTLAVLPIEYALARSIIPRKYKILKKSIKAALPWFPAGRYPASRSLCIYPSPN